MNYTLITPNTVELGALPEAINTSGTEALVPVNEQPKNNPNHDGINAIYFGGGLAVLMLYSVLCGDRRSKDQQ